MTIRVMSSGNGYEYLLKSVVVGDGDREMSSSWTQHYTESGCPPGTWGSTGLMSLDDGRAPALAEVDTVTEEHLARLRGEGIHPVTGDKLGKRFPSLQPPRERIAAGIARLDPACVARHGQRPWSASLRKRLRRSHAPPLQGST